MVCGQGAAGERLRGEAARDPHPGFTLLPLQDDEAYREMMVDTDVCLITQQAGTGQYFFPSKLLSALAFARPVLAVADADSELARAVDEGNFGTVAPSGDPAALAAALDRTAMLDATDLQKLGDAARAYGGRFEQTALHENFLAVLAEVAAATDKAEGNLDRMTGFTG